MKTPQPAAHVFAAASVIAVDYFLASSWVSANYGVRGVVALGLWFILQRAVPLDAGLALPHWGNVSSSLRWLGRFSLVFLPLLAGTIACLLLAARSIGLSTAYAPQVITSSEEASAYLLHGVIAAPLAEELIYRGVVYPRLERAAGATAAILISGPVFWVLHWVDRGGVSPVNHLFAGWTLAWAVHATRSLLAPTVLHSTGNLFLLGLDLLWLKDPRYFQAVLGS